MNVSINEEKGAWFDFVANIGGGILALIEHVRGGSRQDALRWLADFTGCPLEDRPTSATERKTYARERAAFDRDLAEALYWRRPVLLTLERELELEKARLFDPTERPADVDLIREYTRILERLRRAGDATLVAEYRTWRSELPRECGALVRWARDRERAEVRALAAYMRPVEAA